MVLDFTKLSRGERMAGIAGIALIMGMLAFKWYGVKGGGVVHLSGFSTPDADSQNLFDSRNAFQSFTFVDLILLVTALAAIALPLLSASGRGVSLSIAPGMIVALLGVVSVVVIVIRIISPPDLVFDGVDLSPLGAEVTREIGVWLGLFAATGVACGGFAATRVERESASRGSAT